MSFRINAILALRPNAQWSMAEDNVLRWKDTQQTAPTEEEINAKIQELQAAEPMRLLRIERDRLLAATDWRFRIDQEPSQAWYEYCQALRDLPQEIENGNIPAPTLNENGMLVFEHWPERIQ